MFRVEKNKILEFYFRIITVLFWPLYWYKWTLITTANYNQILFDIYFSLACPFIFLLFIDMIIYKSNKKYFFLFKLISVATYIVSLYNFMIYPAEISLLYAKIITCILLMHISIKLKKIEKNDIGVVGIFTSALILTFTYFY